MQISVSRTASALFSVLLFAHFDYLDMIDRVVDVNQAKRECKAKLIPCPVILHLEDVVNACMNKYLRKKSGIS